MLRAVIVAASFALRPATHQASDSLRLVLAAGTTCHSLPDQQSPVAERYHLGDLVSASKSAKGPGGQIWYFDQWHVKGTSPTCWVPASGTVPFSRDHPEYAFAAVADHVLALADSLPFEKLVEAENLLVEPNPYASIGESPLATSGLLQFKRLMLIERAARLVEAHGIEDAPLERAWILAHRNDLFFFEPDAMWFVANDRYWSIFDANKASPWAEELASYAAQRIPPSDECGANCFLSMIAQGPAQYWTRLPSGRSIGKVLALAIQLGDRAIGGIDEDPPTRASIDGVRASLARVAGPQKQALLDRLARLDRAAKP